MWRKKKVFDELLKAILKICHTMKDIVILKICPTMKNIILKVVILVKHREKL